jgi:hypothetical protein
MWMGQLALHGTYRSALSWPHSDSFHSANKTWCCCYRSRRPGLKLSSKSLRKAEKAAQTAQIVPKSKRIVMSRGVLLRPGDNVARMVAHRNGTYTSGTRVGNLAAPDKYVGTAVTGFIGFYVMGVYFKFQPALKW